MLSSFKILISYAVANNHFQKNWFEWSSARVYIYNIYIYIYINVLTHTYKEFDFIKNIRVFIIFCTNTEKIHIF
ncbi:MAG: hypothetical protein N7Q72_03475, partial [Spiroplasma sp. Tabriz.8]|nr:hypothetical protein [Spiroplasma sp. Tabriz.8]